MTRQQIKEGSFISIRLKDESFCFARILKKPLFGFYNTRSSNILPIEELEKKEFLFKVWVMKYAITKGIWTVIGHIPLTDDLKQPETFFKKDPISNELFLYREGAESPADVEDIQGLECAAVWDPGHVEDRLLDHFWGRPNKWVESMKVS